AIGEELGLAGTLAVVSLFVLLVQRGFFIALNARSGFSVLLAAGLTSVLALQALIILAGTLDLIPLTGITLPFVSYGGSSVLANTQGQKRTYAEASLVHTLGFHSAQFGDTNLEAAYDAELRGERALSPLDRLAQQLFHKQPRPNDLVLTIDKRIHDAAVAAL